MRKTILFTTLILMVFAQLSVVEADEIGDLKEQIAEQTVKLQETTERLEQLEARQMQKEKSIEEQTDPADFRVFWKEGLNFVTLDGDFKLKIGGRLQTDWLWSSEDNEIESDVDGEIIDIIIDNAQPVEFNQTLFIIKQ